MAKRKSGEVKIRKHVERITSKRHTYTVNVGGTRDPENHAIVIENAGKTYVENPRVLANEKSDWYDSDEMVRDTVKGFRTTEEKALALMYLFEGTRFQRHNGDRHSVHPPTLLGVYGYGICGHTAAALDALCAAAGIKSRHWEINHHTVTEAHWDGAWHMIDGNVPVAYLKRDNRTIASMAELENDPDLVKRTQPLGGRDHSGFWEWYSTKSYHYHYPSHNKYAVQKKNLGYMLRPFERFERYWTPRYKYHNQANQTEMPRFVGGGKFVFEPDLRKMDMHDLAREGSIYLKNLKRSRTSPVLRVDKPQVPIYDQGSRFIVDVKSPYVIVDGRLTMQMHKSGTDKRDALSVSMRNYDEGRESPTLFVLTTRASGDFGLELDLTRGIQPWGQVGNYFYELAVGMSASGETTPAGVTGIDAFKLETEVQVAPKALPALTLGENTIRYSDESTGGGRDVRIVHLWKERRGGRAPEAPVKLAPTNREKVDTFAPTLEWQQPEGTKHIVDYQVMMSRWSHCRIPHCANLYGCIGSNATHFACPDGRFDKLKAPSESRGWLAPGTTYYWKVRAKDDAGDWGAWSKVASFRTK